MQARGGRQIPIGYSAADYRDALVDTANYIQCTISGTSTTANINSGRSDFFGLNSYTWCNGATWTSSAYNVYAADFANATLPVFFSEFGCNVPSPRTFSEIPVTYSGNLTGFSGGLVYQYTEDTNNFGLVTINSDGSVTILQDYVNLQSQYATLDLTTLQTKNATAASLTLPVCDASLITGTIGFSTNFTLPDQPAGVSSLIKNGAPGASTGSIVSVTSTAIAVVVTPLSGAATSTLSITAASSANTPASTTATAAATGSTSGTGTAATSSGFAAPTLGAGGAAYGAGVAGLLFLALV